MARKIFVILLVFIGFYMGAHYWIRWKNTVTDDVTKISRLVECDPNEVKSIKITTAEGELTFRRTDEPRPGLSPSAQLTFAEWDFIEPIKGEADASSMVRFASMFCELYDPVPAVASDFAQAPGAVKGVSFVLEGGGAAGEHSIAFGGMSAERLNHVKYSGPGGERFVKIQPKLLQLASQKPADYLNMRVMRMSADNVTVVTVFEGPAEKFTMEREGEGWRVIAKGRVLGKGSEEAAKYLNRLSTLKALKADSEGLSPTSCEPGSSRMSVKFAGVGGREEAIYFKYGKKGEVTACNTAREALFTVHRDMIPYLETPLDKLVK